MGPGQGLLGIAADGRSVPKARQVGPLADVIALVGRVAVQDGRQLLPGDVVTGGKFRVADAIHNAVLGGPGHGVGVPSATLHVGEGQVAGDGGLARQAVQDGHQLGPCGLAVGGKQVVPHPVHKAGFVGIADGIIEPIPFRHVGEGQRGFRKGDGHRHLAVGHCEGVGAVGLLCDGHGLPEAVGDRHAPHLVPPVRDGGEGHGGTRLGGGGVCRHGAALGGLHGDSVVGVGGGDVRPHGNGADGGEAAVYRGGGDGGGACGLGGNCAALYGGNFGLIAAPVHSRIGGIARFYRGNQGFAFASVQFQRILV